MIPATHEPERQMTADVNRDQIEHWGGAEGDHWVRHAAGHDRMLAPFADRLAATAQLSAGERVLDIGCGCGLTTVESAATVGPNGAVLGVDLSPQMLDVAKARADTAGVGGWARFEAVDAQAGDLGHGQWDVAISRFGVMFFDDPTAAFANIAGALSPGGRLVFCCWQALDVNDWMLVPGVAAAEHVPLPELGAGDQPGPFSLADADRIRSMLGRAGFDQVATEPYTTAVLVAGGGTIDETMDYLVTSGSGRALLENAAEPARTAAINAVREALEPLHDGDGVRLGAAAWIVTAERRPT
jgi:SAM-dependent methyltransferase